MQANTDTSLPQAVHLGSAQQRDKLQTTHLLRTLLQVLSPSRGGWWLWAGREALKERGWGLHCQQPTDAVDNASWRKGSIVLSCQQQNKQQVKLEQGKYSYTKRKKAVIDSKCDRQWAPEAEEMLTISQHHPSETLLSLPAGGWSPATAPFLFAQISHPTSSLLWEGLISCSQALQKSTKSWVESLENSTPFFKVIA